MFHHAADEGALAIRQTIDIDLDRVIQKTVQQHRRVVRHLDRFAHVAFQIALFMHDFHRPAAEYIGWPHYQRIADFLCQPQRVFLGARSPVRRLPQIQFLQQFLEPFAVFRGIDHVR